jgi:hypothetical protein
MFNFIWLKPWQLNVQLCSYCILEDQGIVLVYAFDCAVLNLILSINYFNAFVALKQGAFIWIQVRGHTQFPGSHPVSLNR